MLDVIYVAYVNDYNTYIYIYIEFRENCSVVFKYCLNDNNMLK